MHHPLFSVTYVEQVGPHVLRVGFDDATEQTIDFEPVLAGALFGPLRDPSLFARVTIDPLAHTLVWPNGADFDPETLHDWPRYVEALARRARLWETDPSSETG